MPQGTQLAADGGFAVSVGTTSTPVKPANSGRWEISIQNPSDTVIWLAEGETAVAGSGYYLAPRGGSYYSQYFNGAIFAIHENKDALGNATTGATKTVTGGEV